MNRSKQKKFLKLYEPVHDRFEKFCRARAYGDMPYDDLINETLLVAYTRMSEIRNKEAFLSFLIGISTRILSNSNRKKKAEVVDDEFILTNYADPKAQMEQQYNVELLHRSLAQIPKEQRETLILFEITGFSIKEITQIQDSGESAVKQRLARGRKALAEIVKNELAYNEEVRYGK